MVWNQAATSRRSAKDAGHVAVDALGPVSAADRRGSPVTNAPADDTSVSCSAVASGDGWRLPLRVLLLQGAVASVEGLVLVDPLADLLARRARPSEL